MIYWRTDYLMLNYLTKESKLSYWLTTDKFKPMLCACSWNILSILVPFQSPQYFSHSGLLCLIISYLKCTPNKVPSLDTLYKTREQTFSVMDPLCCLTSALNKCCNLLNLARCPNYSIHLAFNNTLFRRRKFFDFFSSDHFLDLNLVIDIFQVYLNLNIGGHLHGERMWMLVRVIQGFLRIIKCISCIILGVKR